MQMETQPGSGNQGGGRGRGKAGGGRGGRGAGGFCVCPQCDEKKKHTMGQPCPDQECPKCGRRMVRE
jgi:hypothetical protein